MDIRKSYKFQLRLTKKQARLLAEMLDECRWLYNQLLEYRKLAYEELDISLTKYQQLMLLPLLKEERQTLNNVHSQVLQDVVQRLDKAFEGFFRRCKQSKEKPGYPRFRGVNRYTSFTYPQSGFTLQDKTLYLSKIGALRIKQHRPLEGEVKTCSLQKEANGAWYVTFSCIVPATPQSLSDKAVGVDLGIEHFATLSDGQIIDNPRFFKKEEKAIAKIQKKLAKEKKGSTKRRKLGKQAAKIHRRVRNKRSDFCHKAARKLVQEYQYICIEDLNTKKMVQEAPRFLAKSIQDASWNQFCQILTYKAAEAGRKVGMVNPAYTSQTCSRCGNIKAKTLSERHHKCLACDHSEHRDVNAARNILAVGLHGMGLTP